MQKRYIPITTVTVVLFLVAVGGYLAPAEQQSPPNRTLLDNKGGTIIFTHASHVETMDSACIKCHHTSGNDTTPPPCSQCHVAKFDDVFATSHQEIMKDSQCATCHHAGSTIDNFSHADHEDDYTGGDCQSCHHDESVESEPQSCGNCHTDGDDDIPSLRDANHATCAMCHDDVYQEGVEGCSFCHTRKTNAPAAEQQACSNCHSSPTDQLIPTSMTAFHAACMGCHEEMGAGPFGDDACYQCHMK